MPSPGERSSSPAPRAATAQRLHAAGANVSLVGLEPDKLAALDEIVRNRGYLLNISSLSAASHTPLMGGYTASKAGVEAMTDCLRVERAPSGARVGCVYFGFIDTDLVTASFAHPSTQALTAVPGFVARPAPLAQAVDAIEREPV